MRWRLAGGKGRAGADWRVTRRRTRSEAARAPCGRLPPRESSTPTGMWQSSRSTPHAERFPLNGPRSRAQPESLPPRPLHLGPLFQLSSLPVRVRKARLRERQRTALPPQRWRRGTTLPSLAAYGACIRGERDSCRQRISPGIGGLPPLRRTRQARRLPDSFTATRSCSSLHNAIGSIETASWSG